LGEEQGECGAVQPDGAKLRNPPNADGEPAIVFGLWRGPR